MPTQLRYSLLFRVHCLRFHCISRVSHQRSHHVYPDEPLPSTGSRWVRFACLISIMSPLRLPLCVRPCFVSFTRSYCACACVLLLRLVADSPQSGTLCWAGPLSAGGGPLFRLLGAEPGGSPRFLVVLLRLCPALRPRPCWRAQPFTAHQCCPRAYECRRPGEHESFEALSRGFGARRLRFVRFGFPTRARLASRVRGHAFPVRFGLCLACEAASESFRFDFYSIVTSPFSSLFLARS